MNLDFKTKNDIISYLLNKTSYSFAYLSRIYNNQLYAIYQKTRHSYYLIVEEIFCLQILNPNTNVPYTKEELQSLKLEELYQIKSRYSVEEDFLEEEEVENEEDLEFFEGEELLQMYGPSASEYTEKEWRKKGVFIEDNTKSQIREKEEAKLKEKIIDCLIDAHQRGFIYFPFSKEKLQFYSIRALKKFYNTELKNCNYPVLDELIMQFYLK